MLQELQLLARETNTSAAEFTLELMVQEGMQADPSADMSSTWEPEPQQAGGVEAEMQRELVRHSWSA